MTIRKRTIWIPIIILCLTCSGVFLVIPQDTEPFTPKSSSNLEEPTILAVELLENQSLGWFRARLLLNVTTDVPINMSYFFVGIGESAEKIVSVNSSIFEVSFLSSEIEIFIQPSWNVFPSSFQYQLVVYYINSTTHFSSKYF